MPCMQTATIGLKWFYRPFFGEDKKMQPSFDRWLPITVQFMLSTWNCHFLVESCDFDFYTPWWYHNRTQTNEIIIEQYENFIFFFVSCWFSLVRKGASNLAYVLDPIVCIAWSRSICLWQFISSPATTKICIKMLKNTINVTVHVCEFVSIK